MIEVERAARRQGLGLPVLELRAPDVEAYDRQRFVAWAASLSRALPAASPLMWRRPGTSAHEEVVSVRILRPNGRWRIDGEPNHGLKPLIVQSYCCYRVR